MQPNQQFGKPGESGSSREIPFVLVSGLTRDVDAEFRISATGLPFLADHGFQGITVLPGVFFLEMALAMRWAGGGTKASLARSLRFHHPVLISAQETLLGVKVGELGPDAAKYTVYELSDGDSASPRRPVAEVELCDRVPGEMPADGTATIARLKRDATDVLNGGHFYERLRKNGNEYGGSFRTVTKVWRRGDELLAEIGVPPGLGDPLAAHMVLLDAATQALAPFAMEQGRTMVLRSIEAVELIEFQTGEPLCCHAVMRPGSSAADGWVTADVRVYRSSGEAVLRMDGVRFDVLPHEAKQDSVGTVTLAVAANFTAEPVEEVLKFWALQFGLAARIEFAPYDQLFQQLLSSGSVLGRNSNGANLILLQLEKWAAASSRWNLPEPGAETLQQCFGGRRRHTLPNRRQVAHLNAYETDYLYKEIFTDQCYLKHGIRLPEDATVVDIGANIGMFTLFVLSRCPHARVYAYEPAPAVFDLLQANCSAYGASTDGPRAHAFAYGVSGQPGTARFTFYENSSVFSGFHSDADEDLRAIQTVVRNVLDADGNAAGVAQEDVRDLTAARLTATTHECPLTTVSAILRDNQLRHVDLLKIDAEKSEEEILAGIAEEDWARIDQIVIELHDRTGKVADRVRGLLTAKGYRCAVEHESLLEQSGLFNLFASRLPEDCGSVAELAHQTPDARGQVNLEQSVRELAAALQSFATRNKTPMVLCLCPATGGDDAKLAQAEAELVASIGAIPGVAVISSEELRRMYPVAECYDPHGHQLGDIPYTKAAYASFGTAAFRKVFHQHHRPFKVIALDCDNTLWQGVCAEDGPQGVVLTAPHLALQRFMLRQCERGMLLCLCSKNSEADVFAVLDQRPEMLLKREHLGAWRINWQSKSENLVSLAEELNLGLDSIIFVDDNPVECAEVESRNPGVLTLRLPQDPELIPAFLEHVWAFDQGAATAEDTSRTRMYQENARRERFRTEAPSLRDFIAGLQVRTVVAELSEEDLPRVSQLTLRTNQFNLTTIRRTEAELREFLQRSDAGCITARVSDRFGDYGLVGAVLYELEGDRLRVDTFLLSCRVLGRGVEHAIVAWLGEFAKKHGRQEVVFRCVTTQRNLPAREFLRSLKGKSEQAETATWCFPAQDLAIVTYEPSEISPEPAFSDEKLSATGRGSSVRHDLAISHALQQIAEEWCNAEQIARAAELGGQAEALEGGVEAPTVGSMEETVERIWAQVLGRRAVGLDVNFFDAGGTSLKAVQVIAMMRKQMRQNLSVISLFECPTVRLLAARLQQNGDGDQREAASSSAAQRGLQRRARMAKSGRRS